MDVPIGNVKLIKVEIKGSSWRGYTVIVNMGRRREIGRNFGLTHERLESRKVGVYAEMDKTAQGGLDIDHALP